VQGGAEERERENLQQTPMSTKPDAGPDLKTLRS